MTPAEIINNVRANNEAGHAHCMSLGMSEATSLQQCSDIDHLLAIHAAAVEMLDCLEGRRVFYKTRNSPTDIDAITDARMESIRVDLADLCGWEAEEA